MRPYVIINGVNSNTITGLIITKLPPVTKPQMRLLTEQIDGKDGDINTPLGFSAYDKPLEIGLTAEADVNEVIAYFNQAGKIIFSNEPDKYYNFAIYDAIDFEKLIRFKTATINLHTQPYKYSNTQGAIFLNSGSNTVVNSGNTVSKPDLILEGSGVVNLSINNRQIIEADLTDVNKILIDSDTMNAYEINIINPIKSIKSDINPVQDLHGYSKPWSGGGGKNKLEVTATTQTINGITFTIDNEGVITTSGTFSENTNLAVTTNFFLKAGTYILNGCPSGGSYLRYVVRIENSSAQRLALDMGNGEQFTLAEDTYVWCRIYLYSQDGVGKTFKPMVRLATESDSSFAPYENICPISGFSALNVTRTGVNLGNFQNGYGIDASGNIVVQSGRASTVTPIIINPSLSYYVKNISGKRFIYAVFKDNTLIRRIANVTSGTLLDTTNGNKLYVCLYDSVTVETDKPMVVFDNAITTYKPYNGQTASVNFGQTVYGGSLDVTRGKVNITHGIVDLGTLDYSYSSGTQMFVNNTLQYKPPIDTSSMPYAICSQYAPKSWSEGTTDLTLDSIFCMLTSPLQFRIRDTRYTDPIAFKAAMSGVMLVYELATPTEITTTPENLTAIIGENNVFSDTNGDTAVKVEIDGEEQTLTGEIVTFNIDELEYELGAFANRIVTGNYDNIKLEVGSNTVELTGAFTGGQLTRYSRWL